MKMVMSSGSWRQTRNGGLRRNKLGSTTGSKPVGGRMMEEIGQKEMFKKNLEEKRHSQEEKREVKLEPESDEDSGYDVTSISTSGDV